MAIQKITSGIIQDGAIVAADIVSIANTQITGNIVSSQITSVANTQITGNIVSSQITSVANTQITGNIAATTATTATTATNIAGGSNGTIPYQSASGITQMLSAGSSGQLLQTNGAGAPSWVTASAGALNYLSTVTASNSATLDVENAFNAYNVYMLTGTNIRSASSGVAFHVQMKIGGSYITSGTSYLYHQNYSGSDSAAYGGTSSAGLSYIVLAIGLNSNASNTYNFVMYIYNPSSTTVQKVISSTGTNIAGHPTYIFRTANCSGGNTGTDALTGLRFFTDSGNIATGTFRLYGISNS